MKTYICYFSCPFCKDPCCDDPNEEANEIVDADSKTEARKFFNNAKQCRNMKITRIEEYLPGFSNVTATVNGVTKSFKNLGAAIDWAVANS